MIEQNFEKLDEWIKDDDKVATVTLLACAAHISIEESREIFDKYVEVNKGSKEINVTYILNGRKKGKGPLSLSLVRKDQLEQERELYEEGVNQIIFSIQKAKNIDFNIIALADPLSNATEEDHPLSGTIIGRNCVKRVLRKKILPTLPAATVRGKSTIFTKQNSTVKSEPQKVEKDAVDSDPNKNKASSQGSISNLFSKVAQNKKSEQKVLKQPEKKQNPNRGLSNFFTKQPSKEVQNIEIKKEKDQKETKTQSTGKENDSNDTDDEILKDLEIKEENGSSKVNSNKKSSQGNKPDKKSDLFDSDTDDEILKDLEVKEEKPAIEKVEKKRINKPKSKSSQKKKRGKNDVGNDKSVKKRKRIIVEDESDSDDIFGSDKSDNEDVIEKSDGELEPVKVEKKPLAPKNKRRKAVEKIYEDEDGYIVTKTEYVYETPSEDENEPEKKVAKIEEKPKPKIEKKGSNNSENDVSPNKGAKTKKGATKKAPSGNQPTLMNFFKKK